MVCPQCAVCSIHRTLKMAKTTWWSNMGPIKVEVRWCILWMRCCNPPHLSPSIASRRRQESTTELGGQPQTAGKCECRSSSVKIVLTKKWSPICVCVKLFADIKRITIEGMLFIRWTHAVDLPFRLPRCVYMWLCLYLALYVHVSVFLQTKKRFAKEWGEAEKATQHAEKTEADVNATKLDVEKVNKLSFWFI